MALGKNSSPYRRRRWRLLLVVDILRRIVLFRMAVRYRILNFMKIESYFPEYVLAAFSERSDGSCASTDPGAADNRRIFLSGHGISELQVVIPTLVHSAIVEPVGIEDIGNTRVCDALITADSEVFLSVTAADCPSLYLFDPVARVLALAHCGWRGIVSNIVHNVIKAMVQGFGVKSANIQAFISPSIRSCHFEIKKDVYEKLAPFLFPFDNNATRDFIPGHRNTLDLTHAIVMQLISNGLPPSARNIRLNYECTFCQSDRFFSWRRDKTPERMLAVFGMRKTY